MRNALLLLAFAGLALSACTKNIDPEVRANPTAVTAGEMFLTLTQLTRMDALGNIEWQKDAGGETFNLQRWEKDGKVRYTYLVSASDAPATGTSAIKYSYGVLLDENFNELRRVRLLSNRDHTEADFPWLDSHEFVYLGDDHFIVIAYFEKEVNNIPDSLRPVAHCKVVTPIIQEIENDRVVWEWQGSDYPEFYGASVQGNDFGNGQVMHDYMHLNSVFVDSTDNNLICSFRHLNQIVKIQRYSGNILWRLGGRTSDFALGDDQRFLRQHCATLTDNHTLLFLDNGEATERPYSRVLELQLDETAHRVTGFHEFRVPEVFIEFAGSVQKRGDTYFIGCGSVPKLMEVNYQTGAVNLMMDLPGSSYRAFKY